MNTLCEKISGEHIFAEDRELDLDSFLEIIQLDDSFPLREKLTRETNYIEKTFVDYLAKTGQKSDYLNFLHIVLILAERNNKWMRGQGTLAEKLLAQLNVAIQNRMKKYEEREVQEIGEKN